MERFGVEGLRFGTLDFTGLLLRNIIQVTMLGETLLFTTYIHYSDLKTKFLNRNHVKGPEHGAFDLRVGFRTSGRTAKVQALSFWWFKV